jgi:hypothetical protein
LRALLQAARRAGQDASLRARELLDFLVLGSRCGVVPLE